MERTKGLDFPDKTKKIRINNVNGQEYYVYDLDQDIFGRRKRLYARTKEALEVRIKEEEELRQIELLKRVPEDKNLYHYIDFYFQNALGNIPIKTLKEEISILEAVVKGSQIDVDIDTLTADHLNRFYIAKSNSISIDNIKKIDSVIHKAFYLAKLNGIETLVDKDQIIIPNTSGTMVNFLSAEELERLKKLCKQPVMNRYRENRNVLLFSLYTKMKITDVVKVKKEDLDLKNKVVHFEQKTYDIPEECARWILLNRDGDLAYKGDVNWVDSPIPQISIASYRYPDYEYLFGTEQKDGSIIPIRATTMSNAVKAILNRGGFSDGVAAKDFEKSYFIADYLVAKDKEEYLLEYSKRENISVDTLTNRLLEYATRLEVLRKINDK